MSDFSTILFAKPLLFEGIGRILDFGDTLTEYNRSLTGQQADSYAIAADVRAIGKDFCIALYQFKREVGDVQSIPKKKEK